MKNYLLVLFAVLLSLYLHSQTSYTYSPDSSSLSLLFENAKIDSAHPEFVINIKDEWKNKRREYKIKLDFRGQAMLPGMDDGENTLKVNFKVFGKSFIQKIDSDKNFVITLIRPLKKLYRTPQIKISSKELKRKNWIVVVDSIDLNLLKTTDSTRKN